MYIVRWLENLIVMLAWSFGRDRIAAGHAREDPQLCVSARTHGGSLA